MNIEITEKPDEDEPPKTESLNEELWGLYFTRPDCEEEKYVHAFSFNKEILAFSTFLNVEKDLEY